MKLCFRGEDVGAKGREEGMAGECDCGAAVVGESRGLVRVDSRRVSLEVSPSNCGGDADSGRTAGDGSVSTSGDIGTVGSSGMDVSESVDVSGVVRTGGVAGCPNLLLGRPKGLCCLSDDWPIWLGLRTNGLCFSGEREPALL